MRRRRIAAASRSSSASSSACSGGSASTANAWASARRRRRSRSPIRHAPATSATIRSLSPKDAPLYGRPPPGQRPAAPALDPRHSAPTIPPMHKPPARNRLEQRLAAVVRVHTISEPPDYEQPWHSRGSEASTGSGAIVETARGPRILTNAHCVQDHVWVEVRRYGQAERVPATVEALGHDCDLALLDVDDPHFFDAVQPIPLGPLPRLGQRVTACGYPVGGERLSISEGIVSRIEVIHYVHRRQRLLGIQVDAAINAGSSGGPVLRDGQLIGVAMQTLDDAQRTGYLIPTPVIEHFLRDVGRDEHRGFPELGVQWQPLESPTHREALGLAPEERRGILINRVGYGGSGWGRLEPGDVLLAIDGEPIAADGTIAFRDDDRLDFDHLLTRRHVGETVELELWRDAQPVRLRLPLRPPAHLVAEERYDVKPSYFIFGGMVFAPLTRNYLKTWGEQWWREAPRELVALYEHGLPSPERTEPVVLQQVLADASTRGYHDLDSVLIEAVDGTACRSLRHLVELVESATGRFVRLRAWDHREIVIDRHEARKRHAAILERFEIPADRSPDLRGTDAPVAAPAPPDSVHRRPGAAARP
ncbi:MAG: serine protease [Planctomycetota bacterium]|nr:MAG: serine protease [Planctomycetota bacterium]